MQPLLLTLRGFKGIKSGIGKDEITLDLSNIPTGQIAISGPNGRGKSTILQNLHPFTLMPDRVKSYSQSSFSYYDECFLPDSKKELIFSIDDKTYKSVIEINALKRKTKAFLYVLNKTSEFELIDETRDGNIEDYQYVIEKLVGTPKLFFTSIFRSQDAIKIDKYTKGELKDIFAELLCIDNLKTYSENAAQVSKSLKSKREILSNELNNLMALISLENEAINMRNAIEQNINNNKQLIEEYNKRISVLEKSLSELLIIENNNKNIIEKTKEIEALVKSRKDEIEQLKKFLEVKRNYYNNKYIQVKKDLEDATKIVEQEENIKQKVVKAEAINAQYKQIAEKIIHIDSKINELSIRAKEIYKVEERINLLTKNLAKLESERKKNLERYITLKNEKTKVSNLLNTVPCKDNSNFITSCNLLRNANEAKQLLLEIEKKIQELSRESNEEATIKQEIDALVLSIKDKESIQSIVNQLTLERQTLIETQKKLIPLIENYKNLISMQEKIILAKDRIPTVKNEIKSLLEEGRKTVDEINKNITNIQSEIDKLEAQKKELRYDNKTTNKIENCKKEIAKLKSELEKLISNNNNLLIELGQHNEALRSIQVAKEKRVLLQEKINKIDKEIEEWNIVSKIYSEMIPLEIEDAGPEVSEIANKLLYECFGSRFSITIITQETNKKGDIKDVFEIIVYDAEIKEKKPLNVLSGGERVWIEEAITRAIGIYNQYKSGRRYTTLFTDERDGALDAENRKRYFALKNKVLELGGFKREFFISHSNISNDYADYLIQL